MPKKNRRKSDSPPSDRADCQRTYVRCPPHDDNPDMVRQHLDCICESDMDRASWLALRVSEARFLHFPTTIHALQTFIITYKEMKVYPPLWVLDFLCDGFTAWMDAEGTKKLEDILGLTVGKGQSPYYKKLAEARRDDILFIDVIVLTTLFGISIERASEMACDRLEETPNWNLSSFKIKVISPETVRDRYIKYGRKNMSIYKITPKEFQNLPYIENPKEWWNYAKTNFLSLFPLDSIPPELRHYLPNGVKS